MHEDQVAGLALLEEPELRCLGALDSVRILRLDMRQSRHPSYLSVPAEGSVLQLGTDERQVRRLVREVDNRTCGRPTRVALKRAKAVDPDQVVPGRCLGPEHLGGRRLSWDHLVESVESLLERLARSILPFCQWASAAQGRL